jgi:hypothetical protein
MPSWDDDSAVLRRVACRSRTDRAGRTASLQRIGLASPRQDPCSPRHLAGAHPQGDDPVAPGRPLRGAAWRSQQQPAVVQLYSTCTAHVVAQQAAPRAAILAAAGYSFGTGYVTRMHTTVQQYAYMNSHIHTVRDLVLYSIYY